MFQISQQSELGDVCSGQNFGKMVVIAFYADWNEHSLNYIDQLESLIDISPFPDVVFAKCDAEKVPQVADKFQVTCIPTVIVTETRRQLIQKFENVAPALLIEELTTANEQFKINFEDERKKMYAKIDGLLSKPGIIAFITGTPNEPECGFTRQLVEVFQNLQVRFDYYNTEADMAMLQFIRHYSKWPTFPQVFFNGKLIGGLDVVREHIAKGTLEIPPESRISNPETRLENILNENKAILFLEGKPNEENHNQESKKAVELLQQTGIKFTTFDLTIDSHLKEYLQNKYSKQLPVFFANSNFVGNLTTLQELSAKGDLLQTVPGNLWVLNGEQKINYLLKRCEILVFINGIPKDTKTKESQQIIHLLESKQKRYDFYNVDADAEVEEALKKITGKETIPLIYEHQKLIGDLESAEKHFS
ncbi:monothiol glutaredoxin-S11 protein (macronuclear) [Tetrahymena thermophila SB210]|uniref:Monothiol glutaredoxin-S11 protein n=1 Tax=Tetrahymena thermophila (strain SB210) TaxID=312017 RepID=Q22UE7_TETTS|nr:monothiol glutaredoxin-S11 protein [Tetrahymena thermophila SB210]EAR88740.1 monothiol glutaredoxin-S11 protein [Tetrahymena thermophila SB210]|eukprot:XP_001008985.1 monothiol glutaredoxin-S11 protein [Tetrahymena thermophila SB210]